MTTLKHRLINFVFAIVLEMQCLPLELPGLNLLVPIQLVPTEERFPAVKARPGPTHAGEVRALDPPPAPRGPGSTGGGELLPLPL